MEEKFGKTFYGMFSKGLSMEVVLRGKISGGGFGGAGRLGKHDGKHWSPHWRISPDDQETIGLCCTSQGRPRMISAIEPSRTRKLMDSVCNRPRVSWTGPTL